MPEPDGAAFGHAVPFADPNVTSRKEDADATRIELREQATHIHCVFHREGILVKAVRRAGRLRDARLAKDVSGPGDEPVILDPTARGLCCRRREGSDNPWPQGTGYQCSPLRVVGEGRTHHR